MTDEPMETADRAERFLELRGDIKRKAACARKTKPAGDGVVKITVNEVPEVPEHVDADHEECALDQLLDEVLDAAIGHFLGGPDADGPEICVEHAVDEALQEHVGVPDGKGLCKDCLCDIGRLAIVRLLRHRLV